MKKPVMLLILDGFGLAPKGPGNAIAAAQTPNLTALWNSRPHAQLQASGRYVGLPEGQMGNSEVGHTNMGAGRVVWQELSNISNKITDGSFFENPALLAAAEHAKKNGGALHLFGLLSDGGVHSHIEHIRAAAELAARQGLSKVWVHAFTDGRDTPPTSGAGYVRETEKYLENLGVGAIGTVAGRYYAMDRDKRWERVRLAYEALTGLLPPARATALQAVEEAYERGETDEFIHPCTCNGFAGIQSGDSVIFCNFRPDRARELTRAFVDPDFESYGFERARTLQDLFFVCMTQYDATIPNVRVAYPPQALLNTLGAYLASLGKTQLRIAETEKYAHVTFFFNGGVEEPYPGEKRILIPSPKVATYDLKPEMSAYEVTDSAVREIETGAHDLIVMNLANCDMVGHTGVFSAAVAAVEAVDRCVGRIAAAIEKVGGDLLITADHGNADEMLDRAGKPMTAHSTNPVPLILVSQKPRAVKGGALCDLAPTILSLMDLPKPAEMEGSSLLV